ncbi:hypothetical protein RchiOBHm_Chr4g0397811 [Rosa chinensis]|uniref:Uncharacterized protein n=2 Tax=Rosa chinensis TaxID=74649 RepID=A0A2P6QS42_ROSCH|nr:hypothetical protein RchiOBHm_Chr4g0397811 [Rosa chinensis]
MKFRFPCSKSLSSPAGIIDDSNLAVSGMQTVSEGSSSGIDASEVSSELKSNGQVVDESLFKDSKMDVTEVQIDSSMQK